MNEKHPISIYCVKILWRFCIHHYFQYFASIRLWIISQNTIWICETMWFRHNGVLAHCEKSNCPNRSCVPLASASLRASFDLFFLRKLTVVKLLTCTLRMGFSSLLVSYGHSETKALLCLFSSFKHNLASQKPFCASYSSISFAVFLASSICFNLNSWFMLSSTIFFKVSIYI